MTKEELYNHAKEQEPRVRAVLDQMASAMLELDSIHPNGMCTSYYMDFDEQDMLNAITIFYSVASNYAIKHGLLNEYNTEEKITNFREMVKDTFGLDTIQEVKVMELLHSIKEGGDK